MAKPARSAKPAKRRPGPPVEIDLPDLAPFDGEGLDRYGDYDAVHLLDLDLAHADGKGTTFLGCHIERCRLDDATLVNARFSDCLLTEIGATGFDASDSTWRDSILDGWRVGAMTAICAEWSSIRVRGAKLDFLALAGGRLDDVAFEKCTIEELDLGDARCKNVTFTDCRIGVLDLEEAFLVDVDLRGAELRSIRGIAGLRGATVSSTQLLEMGPLLAAHLGIRVEDETRGPDEASGPSASG